NETNEYDATSTQVALYTSHAYLLKIRHGCWQGATTLPVEPSLRMRPQHANTARRGNSNGLLAPPRPPQQPPPPAPLYPRRKREGANPRPVWLDRDSARAGGCLTAYLVSIGNCARCHSCQPPLSA